MGSAALMTQRWHGGSSPHRGWHDWCPKGPTILMKSQSKTAPLMRVEPFPEPLVSRTRQLPQLGYPGHRLDFIRLDLRVLEMNRSSCLGPFPHQPSRFSLPQETRPDKRKLSQSNDRTFGDPWSSQGRTSTCQQQHIQCASLDGICAEYQRLSLGPPIRPNDVGTRAASVRGADRKPTRRVPLSLLLIGRWAGTGATVGIVEPTRLSLFRRCNVVFHLKNVGSLDPLSRLLAWSTAGRCTVYRLLCTVCRRLNQSL